MRIVVVLPAPLGPRNPKTSLFLTSKETSFNATVGPKVFDRLLAVIIILHSFWKEVIVDISKGFCKR
jgi:hypothetical protein